MKPTDYPTLFLTDNEKTLLNRGPLKFSIDGSNNIVYSHADQLSTSSVTTNQSLVAGNWSHVAVRADFNSSTLSIFLDGQKRDEISITIGSQLELASSTAWTMGGSNVIWRDFFAGQVDDLRFYSTNLSDSDILAIYNDDLSTATTAASKAQIIYDEGTDASGLTISLDDNGFINGTIIVTCLSEDIFIVTQGIWIFKIYD